MARMPKRLLLAIPRCERTVSGKTTNNNDAHRVGPFSKNLPGEKKSENLPVWALVTVLLMALMPGVVKLWKFFLGKVVPQ